ncbi:hypothetical protein OS035_28465 [Rhizobium sp. 268]|uniref:AAA family ATPase n=1 Tax=Rhizobium sp. 268 TaxID=2996375 RepID=UPI002F929E99
MTQLLKPSLVVKRLVVKRGNLVAYDERFHAGVNVIRGENSSGKSTIMNFLFFGLGGDLQHWSDRALLCTHVWLEVELNTLPAVLRREIVDTSRTPMEIFSGRYEEAVIAPLEAWTRYPYQRTANQESFSQALFRLLEMPDVAGEGSGNITMHQILRLLYADQLSPIEDIFRQERVFDRVELREVVGNLLCGAYDTEIYETQLKLRQDERDFDQVEGELKSIVTVIGGGSQATGVQWVEQQKRSIVDAREALLTRVAAAEASFYTKTDQDEVSLKAQQETYEQVQQLQTELRIRTDEIRAVEFEIADSAKFISSLETKIESLRDAETVATAFGAITFSSCPACYQVLDGSDETHACHLCKQPLDRQRAKERIVGLINEAAIQLKQSKQLQDVRAERLSSLQRNYQALFSKWNTAARELEALQVLPSTEARDALRKLHRELGYVDRQLDDIEEKLTLARRIDDLRARKEQLQLAINRASEKIDQLKAAQETRLNDARRRIEKETIHFLRNDLRRQDSFENPQEVQFSFRTNSITVDGKTYFSASSRVILKNSFLLGFLKAALDDPKFRHPRFLLIDITENMGMEPERSHNFQNLVVQLSQQASTVHQIILATAMPSPDIADTDLIGKFSTRDDGTLNIEGSLF